jgi:hypothetical protein
MLQDELFGRQFNHVLVRFHAIAGAQSSDWLRLVSTVRDDELVHSAFKALICGIDSTTKASVRRHRCAEILPAIRKRLASPDATRCLNMIHLVFLLSYQELLVWNNPKAWMMHIWGLSTIVQNLGPHAFKSPLELRTYRLIRLYDVSALPTSCNSCWDSFGVLTQDQVPLNLFLRRRSFLEGPEWLHVPWSDGGTKDLQEHTVDILVFIPGLLREADRVRGEGASIKRLHAGVSRVRDTLNILRYQRLPQHCVLLPGKPVTLENVVQELRDGTLVDAFIAQAVVLYLSTWLLLTRLEPIYTASLPWPMEYLTKSILDICEEYAYRQSWSGVLPWTFALRVAFFTKLEDGDATRARGRSLCVRVESRYSVRLLSDILASLPGQDEILKFDE